MWTCIVYFQGTVATYLIGSIASALPPVDDDATAVDATRVGFAGFATWHLKHRLRIMPFARVAKFCAPQLSHSQSEDSSSFATAIAGLEGPLLMPYAAVAFMDASLRDCSVAVGTAGPLVDPPDSVVVAAFLLGAVAAVDALVEAVVALAGFFELADCSSRSIWRHVLAYGSGSLFSNGIAFWKCHNATKQIIPNIIEISDWVRTHHIFYANI